MMLKYIYILININKLLINILIFIFISQSVGPCVCCVCFVCVLCVFVCVISNQSTSKKPFHVCQTSVGLSPCSIKHTLGDGVLAAGGAGLGWSKLKNGGR